MKTFIVASILALCSFAAFADCVTLQPIGNGNTRVYNGCSTTVQIELRGADDSREMMFLNSGDSEVTGTGGNGQLREFSCPVPAVPSQYPNQPVTVEFSTYTYYCWKNQ
jgi:hypothetical protein